MVYTKLITKSNHQRPTTANGKLRELFYEACGACTYCGRKMEMPSYLGGRRELTATIDHFIPMSKGGAASGDNCVIACNFCNNLKADLLPDEWQAFMDANPCWWTTARKPRLSRIVWGDVCPVMLSCSNALFYERYKNRGIFKPYAAGQTSR